MSALQNMQTQELCTDTNKLTPLIAILDVVFVKRYSKQSWPFTLIEYHILKELSNAIFVILVLRAAQEW